MVRVKQEGIKYYFWVFGMTRPGIEPQSPGPLANAQLPWLMNQLNTRPKLVRTTKILQIFWLAWYILYELYKFIYVLCLYIYVEVWLRVLGLREMQTVSFRIWTLVTVWIFYNVNHYPMNNSTYMIKLGFSNFENSWCVILFLLLYPGKSLLKAIRTILHYVTLT